MRQRFAADSSEDSPTWHPTWTLRPAESACPARLRLAMYPPHFESRMFATVAAFRRIISSSVSRVEKDSSAALAGEGETDFIEDFAVNQFNHMILCVPVAKDTVWLECTSQLNPAGYLGDFTDNRPVLLITENGGQLVHTPAYTQDRNLRSGKVKASLDADGNLTGISSTRFTGPQQEWYYGMINSVSPEKQLDILKEKLNLASYDIRKFHYTPHPDARPVPEITEELEITVANYATVSGKRVFITPNVLNRATRKLSQDGDRKSDVWLRMATRERDTVEITIPDGYTPENSLKPVVIETRFGRYTADVTVEGDRIRYIRSCELKAGRYPAKDYPALEEFLNTIYKTDRNRVILVKKEA